MKTRGLLGIQVPLLFDWKLIFVSKRSGTGMTPISCRDVPKCLYRVKISNGSWSVCPLYVHVSTRWSRWEAIIISYWRARSPWRRRTFAGVCLLVSGAKTGSYLETTNHAQNPIQSHYHWGHQLQGKQLIYSCCWCWIEMCLMKFLTKKDHHLLAGHASSWQQSIHGMDLSWKSFRRPLFASIERKGVTSSKQEPHHLKLLAAEVRGMVPRWKGIQPIYSLDEKVYSIGGEETIMFAFPRFLSP